MTELMRQLAARKVERRRQLAALPVGEKLLMLEEMVAAAKAIWCSSIPFDGAMECAELSRAWISNLLSRLQGERSHKSKNSVAGCWLGDVK